MSAALIIQHAVQCAAFRSLKVCVRNGRVSFVDIKKITFFRRSRLCASFNFKTAVGCNFLSPSIRRKIAKKPLLKSKLIMDYRFPTGQDCSAIISVDFSLVLRRAWCSCSFYVRLECLPSRCLSLKLPFRFSCFMNWILLNLLGIVNKLEICSWRVWDFIQSYVNTDILTLQI